MLRLPPGALAVRPNPFAKLDDASRSYFETAFVEAFAIAVETEDDDEEAWAYGILRQLYAEAIAKLDDRAPSFFDAMAWAAQRRATREPA